MSDPLAQTTAGGIEQTGVLDAFAFDERTDRLVLAMFETRPWTGDPQQGFQLQEKLNAYASFALDGELQEQFPELNGKRVCIQLRTVHKPDDRTLEFLAMVRQQLSFQEVDLETVRIGPDEGPSGDCGSPSCGCRH